MKKIVILVLIVAASLLLVGCGSSEPAPSTDSTPPAADPAPNAVAPVDDTMPSEIDVSTPDHTFVVTGENFKFMMNGEEAPELRVQQGDLVRIEFSSTDGFHDWVLDEFSASTERVQAGGSTVVEFVADQTGTFEYYCSVGSHRAQGMVGNLIVV